MYEALRLVIEVLSNCIAVEEAAADALFTAACQIADRGGIREAETFRQLSRIHRVKALVLQGQIAALRETATGCYRNKI